MLMRHSARLDGQEQQISPLPVQNISIHFRCAFTFNYIDDNAALMLMPPALTLNEMFKDRPGVQSRIVNHGER